MRSMNTLFASCAHSNVIAPDFPTEMVGSLKPGDDFVLCRDVNGMATAVYGHSSWDFNPYRLGQRRLPVIRFDKYFTAEKIAVPELMAEAKYILFCLLHYAGTGRVGKLSPSSVIKYFYVLKDAATFCFEQRAKPLVGLLSLEELFTTPAYLAGYIKTFRGVQSLVKTVPALLNQLAAVGKERLGYRALDPSQYNFGIRSVEKQHPVIPTEIYLGMVNVFSAKLDILYDNRFKLYDFISMFADPLLGYPYKQQRLHPAYKKIKSLLFADVVSKHGLEDLFVEDFECNNRKSLCAALLSMQFFLKCVVHLYTGMRDQEVIRLRRDCLFSEEAQAAVVDDLGVERDPAVLIDLISTTTKFSGFRKEESWLAPLEVRRAVQVARLISEALNKVGGFGADDHGLLFQVPSVLFTKAKRLEVSPLVKASTRTKWLDVFKITQLDLEELACSDPKRDFHREAEFAVGRVWPLTSHQFRRSLAYYASNSGFVGLPSIKQQFKHLTLAMSRYYRNGFERLKTIFGYFDEESGTFVLPKNHVAFDFQMAIPIDVANEIISSLLGKNGSLGGGTGSFMEKRKKDIESGNVDVVTVREETIHRVKRGELAHRPTLLGGCTKVGRCDDLLLGDFASCVSCESSIIHGNKLDSVIEDIAQELSTYPPDSGEYQILAGDLGRLIRCKSK